MDYELYVQTEKSGAWERLDFPDLSVPMNYQINTLAELKERNGAYSQSISFPRSPHNMKIFGFGLDIDVMSDIPYKRHRCQLFCNGILVSPPGAVLVVNALKRNTIETNIISGTVDLVNVLKSKPMTSAETDGFWRMLDINNIAEAVITLSNGVKIVYPFATLMTNIPENGFNSTPKGFTGDSAHIYPHLNFYDTVAWILKQEGYSLETDLLASSKLAVIPCLDPVRAEQTEQVVSFSADITAVGGTEIYVVNSEDVTSRLEYVNIPNSEVLRYKNGIFNGEISGRISISPEDTRTRVRVVVHLVGQNIDVINQLVTGVSKVEFNCHINAGEYMTVQTYAVYTAGVPNQNFRGAVVFSETENLIDDNIPEEPTPGITYDLLSSLGFKTRHDFLNAFIKFYGLTIDIDPEDKVLRAYSFNKIYGNKGQAYDWSGKLTMDRDTDINYRADGYAKTNLIQMKENKDNEVTDIFSFPIEDDSLDEEKDLYSVDFMVTGNSRYPEDYVTINYPIYEIERTDDGNEMNFKAKYKKPTAPHIVSLSTYRDLGINVTQGSASKRVSLYLARTYTLTKVLPNYIGHLKDDILNRYKKLTAYFALTPADIEDIDLFTPVWLEQYGHYFYIAKINNFIAGRLTKVDLIRM